MQTSTAHDTSSSIIKRRARNRVSQKSFRERQALYVRQLESQLADRSSNESTKIQAVQKESDKLRQALLAARKRILGLTTALSGVSENIGIALRLEVDSLATKRLSHAQETRDLSPEASAGFAEEEAKCASSENLTLLSRMDAQLHQEKPIVQVTSEGSQQPALASSMPLQDGTNIQLASPSLHWPVDAGLSLDLDMNSSSLWIWQSTEVGAGTDIDCTGSNTTTTTLDHSKSLQRDGFQKSTSVLDTLTSGATRLGEARITADIHITFPPGNTTFPSTFSAHLAACEFFIKQNKAYKQRTQPGGSEALSKLISNTVNMFVNTAWPDMRVWWAYLQSSSTVEKIMRWRLDPGLESYIALPACHRPTPTQLCKVHPTIIDWGFFPSIRDRMIELYSYSAELDQLMCELLGAYVVEADISNFIIGPEHGLPQKGYFRIWDLVQTFSKEEPDLPATSMPYGMSFWQDGTVADMMSMGQPSPFQIDEDEDSLDWTPIPLEEALNSKKAALKLFRLLHMEDRQRVKLDPIFALNHPELCNEPTILASGLDCTIKGRAVNVPLPKRLTRETILNYKMMLWKTSMG